jgi:hypothetical protein
MTPFEYRRKRDLIERECIHRAASWRKRDIKRLNKEAQATPVQFGRKVIGQRLPSGRVVCVKQRFKTEDAALGIIAQIAREPANRLKPIRAFPCYVCGGWHLTKQPRNTHS